MPLTVKHTDEEGYDRILMATEVCFDKNRNAVKVFLYDEGSYDSEEFFGGTVYVMNQQGTTVQIYRMGKK